MADLWTDKKADDNALWIFLNSAAHPILFYFFLVVWTDSEHKTHTSQSQTQIQTL